MSFIRVVLGVSMLFAFQTFLMVTFDIVMTFVNKLQKKDYTWKSSKLFLKASSWDTSLFQVALYLIGIYGIVKFFIM